MKSASLFALRLSALFNALRKFGSEELLASDFSKPDISTSMVTFIPP